jgi:hypothetical protein
MNLEWTKLFSLNERLTLSSELVENISKRIMKHWLFFPKKIEIIIQEIVKGGPNPTVKSFKPEENRIFLFYFREKNTRRNSRSPQGRD